MEKRSHIASGDALVTSEREARRDFLRRAGKVAVAAPAAVLLLRAQRTPAAAQGGYGSGPGKPAPRTK